MGNRWKMSGMRIVTPEHILTQAELEIEGDYIKAVWGTPVNLDQAGTGAGWDYSVGRT